MPSRIAAKASSGEADFSAYSHPAGLIGITAFISSFRAERQMVRAMMHANEFIEIFVDTPLEVAEARDVKGLYRKARSGKLKNFTGVDSPTNRRRIRKFGLTR